MVRPERFELPTLCFEGRCSIQLSYGRVVNYCNPIIELAAYCSDLFEQRFLAVPNFFAYPAATWPQTLHPRTDEHTENKFQSGCGQRFWRASTHRSLIRSAVLETCGAKNRSRRESLGSPKRFGSVHRSGVERLRRAAFRRVQEQAAGVRSGHRANGSRASF